MIDGVRQHLFLINTSHMFYYTTITKGNSSLAVWCYTTHSNIPEKLLPQK